MSVDIPVGFEILDPVVNMPPGKRVGESPLAEVGANSNYLYGAYACMLGAAIAPDANGWEPFTTTYATVLRLPRPANADASDVTIAIRADNQGVNADVKAIDADTADSDTAAVDTGVAETVSLTVASSTNDSDIEIQGQSDGPSTPLQILSVSYWWAGFSGTVDAARDSGVTLVGDHESGADYGVTDELLSRVITNPRRTWAARRGLVALAATQIVAGASVWSTTSGSRVGQMKFRPLLRAGATIRWWVYAVTSASPWSVELVSSDGQTVVIDSGSGTVSGSATWYVETAAYVTLDLEFTVYLKADGVHRLDLWTLAGEVMDP